MPRLTEQQHQAVHSIDRNVIVSAGAGSGKTMVLVERYLRVLEENPDATISDIVAVTFTRKAAEEMRSRLKSRLKDIAQTCADEARPRWNELLFQVDHARIGTIHSLCESILRAFPVEAQIDPQFEVLDDLTRADLMNTAVEEVLQEMIAEPDPLQLMLLEYPVESIRLWIIHQLESIPQYRNSRASMGTTPEAVLGHAKTIIDRVKTAAISKFTENKEAQASVQFMFDNPWHDKDSPLEQRRLDALRLMHAIRSAQTVEEKCQLVVELAEQPKAGSAGGPKGKDLRAAIKCVREAAEDFVKDVPVALTDADEHAAQLLTALLGLIDKSVERYEAAKGVAQKIDYNDLIGRTHALVTHPESSARRHLSEKIRALLVDEFQDTNRIQSELLASICGSKARLFLIGDDKQSIYKFQGADVSTFNYWKDAMATGTHGLTGDSDRLDLSYSFRSHPSIVEFVNRFFSFYFSHSTSADDAHRARHQALIPSREDEKDPKRVEIVYYDCIDAEQQKRQSEQARTSEAKGVAAWILEKIGAGTEIFDKEAGATRAITFGDFAILVQRNSDFAIIETALSDAQIPYVTFAGKGFLTRQEIYDIENMLRWIDTPEDNHALLGVLRSPFFGLNDAVLHRIYTESAGTSLWRALITAAKQPDFGMLQKPVAVLRKLRQESENCSLPDLVRKIITITSYDVILLSMPNGKQKSRNAWKMATFASEYSHMSISDFLRAMQTMRDLGANKQTDAPLSSEAAVKLMTIHTSKGLEFPAVIMPVMGCKVHLPPNKLLVHRDFGIALDTSRSSDDPKPSFYRAALKLSCEMDEEEKKRLLYVAMTRARDFLVMFIERSATNQTSFRRWFMEAEGKAVVENEHFTSRFFDKDSIDSWHASSAELSGTLLRDDELESLSEIIGFDLLAAAETAGTDEHAAPNWQALRRVTATNTAEDLHPVVVGNLFHAAMQHFCLRKTIPSHEQLLGMALAPGVAIVDADVRSRLVDEVERLLQVFCNQSKLHEMLQTARRVLPEVTYMICANNVIHDKRPDLIFQDENDAWHIVDFKTDRVVSGDLAAKIQEHSLQVTTYVTDLARLTGAKATGWLYFAHIGAMEEIEPVEYVVGKKGQLKLPISM
jgi:ATP-dependent helicase/nuclease subunit A